MRKPLRRYRCGIFLLLWAQGCSVGAALVDEGPDRPKTADLAIECTPPPRCEPLQPPELPPLRDVLPLSACPDTPATPNCVAAPDARSAAFGVPDSDAGQAHGLCSSRGLAQLPAQANCQDLRIALGADTPTISLQNVHWTRSNLTLIARHPVRVELPAATLQHVFIQLEGPVHLQIERAEATEDLRVVSQSTENGDPGLALSHLNAQELSVGDGEQMFAGTVALSYTKLARAQLSAPRLELQSVTFGKSHIAAGTLLATDATFTDSLVSAESAVLSACFVTDSRLTVCDGTLIAGETRMSTVETCGANGKLRLYTVALIASALDGDVESDNSHLERVRLGAASATQLVSFDNRLVSLNVCANVTKLALGGATRMHCSRCDHMLAEPEALCIVPGIGLPPDLENNYCEQLTNEPRPPPCLEPLPERPRPTPGAPP